MRIYTSTMSFKEKADSDKYYALVGKGVICASEMSEHKKCQIAWVENPVGSDSFRVSEVIQSFKGITVEILNTDAEGRLILAETMSYAQDKFRIQEMIELSMLTSVYKKKGMLFIIIESGENYKSTFLDFAVRGLIQRIDQRECVADINNSSSGKVRASAVAFLECFVEKKARWMHWDIANVAAIDKNEGIHTKGVELCS